MRPAVCRGDTGRAVCTDTHFAPCYCCCCFTEQGRWLWAVQQLTVLIECFGETHTHTHTKSAKHSHSQMTRCARRVFFTTGDRTINCTDVDQVSLGEEEKHICEGERWDGMAKLSFFFLLLLRLNFSIPTEWLVFREDDKRVERVT